MTAAVCDAVRRRLVGFDAVKHLLLACIERRPVHLDLTRYPHLPQRRQADQAVGVRPARDRRERRRRRYAHRIVRMVDEDLVFDREARLESHVCGLVGCAPEHRARTFGRHGAVRVVEVEHHRHRVRAPGQAVDRGRIRPPVNVGEAVLVVGERREVHIVRGGEPVDNVGKAHLVGKPLVEGEQLAAQPAVELRDLDLNEAHSVRAQPLANLGQFLGPGAAHTGAPPCAPAAVDFSWPTLV